MAVMCVIKRSVTKVFSRDIFYPVVNSSHNPMYVYVIHYGALSKEPSPFTYCAMSIPVVYLKKFSLYTYKISHLRIGMYVQ